MIYMPESWTRLARGGLAAILFAAGGVLVLIGNLIKPEGK